MGTCLVNANNKASKAGCKVNSINKEVNSTNNMTRNIDYEVNSTNKEVSNTDNRADDTVNKVNNTNNIACGVNSEAGNVNSKVNNTNNKASDAYPPTNVLFLYSTKTSVWVAKIVARKRVPPTVPTIPCPAPIIPYRISLLATCGRLHHLASASRRAAKGSPCPLLLHQEGSFS